MTKNFLQPILFDSNHQRTPMIRRMILQFLLCLSLIPFCTGSGVSIFYTGDTYD